MYKALGFIIVWSFIITKNVQSKTLPSDFMLLGLTPTSHLIHGLPCKFYRPFIGDNTDYLCEKIPRLHSILYQSNILTRQECQHRFRDHPWGCRLSSNVIPLRKFLRQASKEASFYTTLASAILTINLINACNKGEINDSNCMCSNNRQLCQINPNIAFHLAYLITDGLNMTKTFQDNFLFKVNQANKELGRQIVETMMNKQCHCFGASGSCELKVCRAQPATFANTSLEIYSNHYMNAYYASSNDYRKIEGTKQLIYAYKSINYCSANAFMDEENIKDRECFSHEGCEQACCNRGYKLMTETKLFSDCHCVFSIKTVSIECQPCHRNITRMICK